MPRGSMKSVHAMNEARRAIRAGKLGGKRPKQVFAPAPENINIELIVGKPDPDAIIRNDTPPRDIGEIAADAAKQREALVQRLYAGGELIVNGQNSLGRHVHQLSRERERAERMARGDLPQPGRYQTRFDIFK